LAAPERSARAKPSAGVDEITRNLRRLRCRRSSPGASGCAGP